jgi:chromosome partitioning protein
MRRIAVTNQKGGSGKTTTAVNLAAALGEQRKRVLLLDLDPQCSATNWYGIRDTGRGVFDALVDDDVSLESIVHGTDVWGVEIVPASVWLVGAEKALSFEAAPQTVLRRNIEQLPGGSWDYLLVDCPSTLGLLTVNALAACSEVLVPVECSFMALAGLAQLHQTVERIRKALNPGLEITGLLACRVDRRTRRAQEVVERLREHSGQRVYRTEIRENARLRECSSVGQPITLYDPRSHGAEDYRGLAKEVIRQERKR